MRICDPAQIFDSASEFHRACDTLSEEAARQDFPPFLMYPRIVMSSFTSEVYLKCLHAIHNSGRTPDGHDLYKLFRRLDPKTKTFITAIWESNKMHKQIITALSQKTGVSINPSLEWCLEQGGNHFEAFRYVYEKRPTTPAVLGPLPNILRSVVLTTRPDWQQRAAPFMDRPAHWAAPHTPSAS